MINQIHYAYSKSRCILTKWQKYFRRRTSLIKSWNKGVHFTNWFTVYEYIHACLQLWNQAKREWCTYIKLYPKVIYCNDETPSDGVHLPHTIKYYIYCGLENNKWICERVSSQILIYKEKYIFSVISSTTESATEHEFHNRHLSLVYEKKYANEPLVDQWVLIQQHLHKSLETSKQLYFYRDKKISYFKMVEHTSFSSNRFSRNFPFHVSNTIYSFTVQGQNQITMTRDLP